MKRLLVVAAGVLAGCSVNIEASRDGVVRAAGEEASDSTETPAADLPADSPTVLGPSQSSMPYAMRSAIAIAHAIPAAEPPPAESPPAEPPPAEPPPAEPPPAEPPPAEPPPAEPPPAEPPPAEPPPAEPPPTEPPPAEPPATLTCSYTVTRYHQFPGTTHCAWGKIESVVTTVDAKTVARFQHAPSETLCLDSQAVWNVTAGVTCLWPPNGGPSVIGPLTRTGDYVTANVDRSRGWGPCGIIRTVCTGTGPITNLPKW